MNMSQRTTVLDAAVIVSANSLVWTLQTLSLALAIVVSLVSTVWITVQTIRFCQKWYREEHAHRPEAEKLCQLRRSGGSCPAKAPPTTPGDLT